MMNTYRSSCDFFIIKIHEQNIPFNVAKISGVTEEVAKKMSLYPFVAIQKGKKFLIKKFTFLRQLFQIVNSQNEKRLIRETMKRTSLEEFVELPSHACEAEEDLIN